jgi:hypothetical protein
MFCFLIFRSSTCLKSGADSISIGDTLCLDITSPVSQIEANSGQVISYSKATNLGTAIGLGELVKPTGKEAANDFDYYLVTGTKVNNPNTQVVREYLFSEISSSYQLRLGIIPKRKGIFSIGLSNAANVYRENDKCTKAGYELYFTNTEQHLYYINQVFGTVPDDPKKTYCFKVI